MANVVTEFRQALVAHLTTVFTGADVKTGKRAGVWRGPGKDRIHVFFAGWNVDAARLVVGKPVMMVRYWKVCPETPSVNEPRDPEELEQAGVDLLAALRTIQADVGAETWFFYVEQLTVDDDPDEWGVEARLTGFTDNIATIP